MKVPTCTWCSQRIRPDQRFKKHSDGKLYHLDCLLNKVAEATRNKKK